MEIRKSFVGMSLGCAQSGSLVEALQGHLGPLGDKQRVCLKKQSVY